MSTPIIVVAILGGAFVLQRIGLLPNVSLTRELVWTLFLDVLLLLGLLGLLSKAWSIAVVVGNLNTSLLVSPSQNPVIDTVSTVALGCALYGIWRRRKWGAYLVLARLVFTIAVQLVVYQSLGWQLFRGYSGTENVVADLIGGAMWLLAFSQTWSWFS